jgi:hypothetical protein
MKPQLGASLLGLTCLVMAVRQLDQYKLNREASRLICLRGSTLSHPAKGLQPPKAEKIL